MKKILVIAGLLMGFIWTIYNYSSLPAVAKESRQDKKVTINTTDTEKGKVGIEKGNKAPDFELQTVDGKKVRLSDFLGKKVILNFWTTWCPPCKGEMPDMQKFYEEQAGTDVEILAVNLTTAETNTNNVEKFVKEYGLTFPVLLDIDGKSGATFQAYTIPTTYIINSKGDIEKKIIGPMEKEMMENIIKNIE